MTNNISLLLKKYSVPALFLIFAIAMLVFGLQSNQNGAYMLATALMFAAGLLSFLYSSGKLSPKLLTILGLVAGVGAMGTMLFSTKSVADTESHIKKYGLCKLQSETNLKDIRTAQKAFAERNGRYAKDWDELVDFIKNGKVPFVDAEGVVPGRRIDEGERAFLYGDNRAIDNNMTELEALRLSKNPNLGASFLDKNLGDDKKSFESGGYGKIKEKNFNEGLKGFKKYPNADKDYDRFPPNRQDLNDIEEEEIDYRKKRN